MTLRLSWEDASKCMDSIALFYMHGFYVLVGLVAQQKELINEEVRFCNFTGQI